MSGFLQADGIWFEVKQSPPDSTSGRAALFLDRDGIVVDEVHYLHKPADVKLIDGAAAVIATANRAGIPVILITNQAGIGRGYYGWPEFAATQAEICARLRAEDAELDAVVACPFHADAQPPYRHPNHPCRKPGPGMLLMAADALNLDLKRSWVVGDQASDLRAGRAAGLPGGLHVLTGHGQDHRSDAETLRGPDFDVRLADSVSAALRLPVFP